jgi:hypothetical protein
LRGGVARIVGVVAVHRTYSTGGVWMVPLRSTLAQPAASTQRAMARKVFIRSE